MSRKGKREGKTTAKQRLSTRQLMNTRRITEYSLETYDGDELGTYANDADATYVVGDTDMTWRPWSRTMPAWTTPPATC